MNIVPNSIWAGETARRTSKSRVDFLIVCLCFLIGAITVQPAVAEEYVSDDWRFTVSPYFWALTLDGDITVKGNKNDVDIGFSEILEHMNFAVMFEVEAHKKRVGLFVNPAIAQLEDKLDLVDITINLDIVDFGGSYRLGPWLLSSEAGSSGPVLVTDLYAGGRYTYIDVELDGRVFGILDIDHDKDWFDPIIGARAMLFMSPRWTLAARGDYGGFGIGSNYQWQATGTIAYNFHLFGDDNARLHAGYRALRQDYSDGSGTGKFEWDVTLHGPVFGLSYHF